MLESNNLPTDYSGIRLRSPKLEDGVNVSRLIEMCPPLDTNSIYCNLLQCSHFSNTSVLAEDQHRLLGFISAYRLPSNPDTLFIWQVAVSGSARASGLASAMLSHLLTRPIVSQVRFIETSITERNSASWALFKRFAKTQSAQFHSRPWMEKDIHFSGQHDSEVLVRIGPLPLSR